MQDSVIGGDVNVTNVHHHHAPHQQPPPNVGVSKDQIAMELMQIHQGKNKKFNPELAALMSLLLPGVGYIQIGKSSLGWAVLIIALLFLFSIEIGFIVYIGMGLGTAFHAYTLAHQLNGDLVHI
jgi:hypothetical protein